MTNRSVADIRLCHTGHFDGRLNSDRNVELLKSVGKSKRIHNRCEHTYMVGSGSVHITAGAAAPEVSSAYDEAYLNAHLGAFFYVFAHVAYRVEIDTVTLFAGENLTAEL